MPFKGLIRRSSSKTEERSSVQNTSQKERDNAGFLKRFRKGGSQSEELTGGKVPETRATGRPRSLSAEAPANAATRDAFNAKTGQLIGASDAVILHGLARKDVRSLFYGAPHFMLEKGRHGRFYPQIIFPWNDQLEIADLWDRRPLRHVSFGIATLHAHLPVPDEYDVVHGARNPIQREVFWKGATFEVGVFEVPNMLGFEGREVGTISFRHFLELPIADEFRSQGIIDPDEHDQHGPTNNGLKSPASTGRKASHDGISGHRTRHTSMPSRSEILHKGPEVWKTLSVRSISFQDIAQRLEEVSGLHDKVVVSRQRLSILSETTVDELYQQLFNKFLYPPSAPGSDERHALCIQIETLVNVLASPGVWFDFSLPHCRMELGQILCATPPRMGEDGDTQEEPQFGKKWLYVQILLAVELLLRLDAVIKGDIAKTSGQQTNVTARDIHHFNRLRNRKTDFDLVLARRFLDYFQVESTSTVRQKGASEIGYGHRDGSLSSNGDTPHLSIPDRSDDLVLIPRRGPMQFEGLMRFAHGINWPNSDDLERTLAPKVKEEPVFVAADAANPAEHGDEGLAPSPPSSPHALPSTPKSESIFNKRFSSGWHNLDTKQDSHVRSITLHQATARNTGSWVSRSWLAGMVLPGSAISHFLMAAVLENDPAHPLEKLGEQASLCGGLVLDGQSWWSKFSVVSRVLGSLNGTAECMGWVSLPSVLPVLHDGMHCPDGWIEVSSENAPPGFDNPRLFDGPKVAQESSPLGVGQGKVTSTEFSVPPYMPYDHKDDEEVSFHALRLHSLSTSRIKSYSATTEFSLHNDKGHRSSTQKKTFHLRYDIHFICGQPCRLPIAPRVFRAHSDDSDHPELGLLTAHPLHESFRYKVVTLNDLLSLGSEDLADAILRKEVIVIDARGSNDRDAFARAWCSETNNHGLVSREGKVCLSCSIREARALGIDIVIRIGCKEKGWARDWGNALTE